MGFLDDIQQFYRLSESIDRKTMQAVEEMCDVIDGLPFDGEYLNDGSNGGPVIAIVKFSSIRNGSWDPAYHLPAEQSKRVRKYLSNFKTTHAIVNAVKKIIKNGYVQENGSNPNDRTYLNKNTMKAIKNSDLGKYASIFIERSWVVYDDRDMWLVCKNDDEAKRLLKVAEEEHKGVKLKGFRYREYDRIQDSEGRIWTVDKPIRGMCGSGCHSYSVKENDRMGISEDMVANGWTEDEWKELLRENQNLPVDTPSPI